MIQKHDRNEDLRSFQKVSENYFTRPSLPSNLSLDRFNGARRSSLSEDKNLQLADCSPLSCRIETKFRSIHHRYIKFFSK